MGIALHDSGWPDHDEAPTINPNGQPLDVFETPRSLALSIWQHSVNRVTERDVYAGLLVNLHMFSLSIFSTQSTLAPGGTWDLKDPRARFEVNRFQHKMVEIQESLRLKLGMRTDLPLEYGVARNSTDPAERRLAKDFQWLAAMDQLSLCICCTQPPFNTLSSMSLSVNRPVDEVVMVDPWPFKQTKFQVTFPFRRLPVQRYADQTELCSLFRSVSPEQFTVTVQNSNI